MSIEDNDKDWDEIPVVKAQSAQESNDDSDPNADLYSEDVAEKIIKKAVKKPAAPVEEDESDDDVETDIDVSDDEPENEVEESAEDADEPANEDSSKTVEPTEQEATNAEDKKKSRIPKRIEQLMSKLEEKDEVLSLREMEFAQREAELIQTIQEFQKRASNNAVLVASSQVKEAEAAIEAARRKLRAARNSADEDMEMEAIEELTESKVQLREAKALADSTPKTVEDRAPVNTQQVIAKNKNARWVEANKNILSNPMATNLLVQIDSALQQEGFNPVDDDYREEMSNRLNKAFEKRNMGIKAVNPFKKETYDFSDEDEDTAVEEKEPAPVAKKKPLNPMSKGSPMPSKKSKTLARLDESDKFLTHKFGLRDDVLLKQKAYSTRTFKDGYTPIYIPTNKKGN